jgi:hypothetical protein
VGDGECHFVLKEVASFLKGVHGVKSDEFVQWLQGQFLPSAGCPPDVITACIAALQQKGPKPLEAFLKLFVSWSQDVARRRSSVEVGGGTAL